MNYLNQIKENIYQGTDLNLNKQNSFKQQYELVGNSVTRTSSVRSIDKIVIRLSQEKKDNVLFIGICGGQGSGKKKISHFFNNKIKNSECISEMSFFKPPDEKNRIIPKEDEYLVEDNKFYSKKRRLYLIDLCNPESYDYEKFYETLTNLRQGKEVKIPYFDEQKQEIDPKHNKNINPRKTPLIIIDGYFIFKNKKIRELLNLKIFKEAENDLRLSRLVEKEENFLKKKVEAYEIFFSIYEKFNKSSFDENIAIYRNEANIILPDYEKTEKDEIITDEILDMLVSNLNKFFK